MNSPGWLWTKIQHSKQYCAPDDPRMKSSATVCSGTRAIQDFEVLKRVANKLSNSVFVRLYEISGQVSLCHGF